MATWRDMRCLARLHTLSHLMGFLLYAMALEPIWLASKGSSICRREGARVEGRKEQGNLLHAGQQPYVSTYLVSSGTEGGEPGYGVSVHLAGKTSGQAGTSQVSPYESRSAR